MDLEGHEELERLGRAGAHVAVAPRLLSLSSPLFFFFPFFSLWQNNTPRYSLPEY